MKLLGYTVYSDTGRIVKMPRSLRSALYHANKHDGTILADYGTGCMVEDSVVIWEDGRGTPVFDRHTDVSYALG